MGLNRRTFSQLSRAFTRDNTIKKIQVTEEGQVVTLDLRDADHFRITVMGSYNFTLDMPVGGFDGQPFMVEVKGKPLTSWDDDAVDSLMTFHHNWHARYAKMMTAGEDELAYNRTGSYGGDGFVQETNALMQIKVQNQQNNFPHWILDSIVLDDFIAADFDGVFEDQQGVLIKEIMNVYAYNGYTDGELTSASHWY
jgi:hypothetical protein